MNCYKNAERKSESNGKRNENFGGIQNMNFLNTIVYKGKLPKTKKHFALVLDYINQLFGPH